MAMIALKNLYEQGKFTESEHRKECVREVQRSSDSICAFIDESLVRAKGKRLKRSEVFNMYEEYCKENGRQGHGKSNFFKNMTDKGFLLKQYNGEFYYQDIAVKEEDFCPVDPEERIPFEGTDTDYKQLQLNMNQGIRKKQRKRWNRQKRKLVMKENVQNWKFKKLEKKQKEKLKI